MVQEPEQTCVAWVSCRLAFASVFDIGTYKRSPGHQSKQVRKTLSSVVNENGRLYAVGVFYSTPLSGTESPP
jgi:hypothetical protein